MPENRCRGLAAALIAAPGLMLLGSLVQAPPEAHDTAAELASIATQTGRATWSAALGFVAMLLMVPAFLGMARPLWATHPRLTLGAVSLGVTGVLALTALMGSAPVTVAMVAPDADRPEMLALTDRYESSPLVIAWIVLMMLGINLAPLVLGVALWRSGWSGYIPASLGVGLLLMLADAGRWPLAVGYGATWLGMALVGLKLWRTSAEVASQPVEPAVEAH